MTAKQFIKKWLSQACINFTLLMVLYTAIAAIVNVNDDKLLLDASRCALFFVFAVLLAAANTLFDFDSLHIALKITVHYVVTAAGFYVCLLLPLAMQASGVLVGLSFFTVIYFAVLAVVALFRAKYKRNRENSEAYKIKQKSRGK